MNKKLFFAGFALLAAVSFTSCNSDNPIDITNSNGVSPSDGSHAIGGAYDWTVTPKNVKQLDSLWNVDKKTVQANIANEKIASICINVENFTLENAKSIDIPELWSTGTKANGKVVKVTVSGNFKNADYLRADFLKNGAKRTKFPAIIDTKNVAGSEVQFTLDGTQFDLQLETEKARSILNGTFEIGYFKANAAEGMSATEVQSGTVKAIDVASAAKGDVKEASDDIILGAWTTGTAVDVVAGKGIPVGTNKYIYAKDVYVEADATINNIPYNAGAGKTFKLGEVNIVNPNTNVTVTFKNEKVEAEKIVGAKNSKNFVTYDDATFDLSKIDEIENVTVKGAVTLKKDIFTGVIFNDAVTFNTGDITSFADVTFNALNIEIDADNVTVAFDKVNFLAKATLKSTMKYTYTEAGYNPTTYQWIISDNDPQKGYYEKCKNDLSDLKEYNKGKDIATYTTDDVQWDGTNKTFVKGTKNDKSGDAKKYAVVVIKTPYAAGTYTITPEGTLIDMTKTCKFKGDTDDNALNGIWGNVAFKDEGAWYSVKYADTLYKWRKLDGKTDYVLVK